MSCQQSADYVGEARKRVETLTGAPALFFQGCCGDLNPTKRKGGYTAAKEMGAALGEAFCTAIARETALQAALVSRAGQPPPPPVIGLHIRNERIDLPLEPVSAEQAASFLQQQEASLPRPPTLSSSLAVAYLHVGFDSNREYCVGPFTGMAGFGAKGSGWWRECLRRACPCGMLRLREQSSRPSISRNNGVERCFWSTKRLLWGRLPCRVGRGDVLRVSARSGEGFPLSARADLGVWLCRGVRWIRPNR